MAEFEHRKRLRKGGFLHARAPREGYAKSNLGSGLDIPAE